MSKGWNQGLGVSPNQATIEGLATKILAQLFAMLKVLSRDKEAAYT
jgi:hypothetical protein